MGKHASNRTAPKKGQWHLRCSFLLLVALSPMLIVLLARFGHRPEDLSVNVSSLLAESSTVVHSNIIAVVQSSITETLPKPAPISLTLRPPLHPTFQSEAPSYGTSTSDLAHTDNVLLAALGDANQTLASSFGLNLLLDDLQGSTSGNANQRSRNYSEFESVLGALLDEESPSEFASLLDAIQSDEPARQVREVWLQDLGMYDSGTNLLYDTVAMNFPLCTINQEKPYLIAHLLSVKDFCVRYMSIDKHSNPTRFLAAAKGISDIEFNSRRSEFTKKEQIVIVAMVRDPLAQLQGWKKSPYEMKHCIWDRKEECDWLEQKCKFRGLQTQKGKGRAGGNFSSIPEVWNAYGRGYRQLQLEGGYKEVLITKYEDIVMHPHNFIRRLAVSLNVTLPAALATATRKAKMHGRASDRAQAMKMLRSREFVRSFSQAELEAACKRLDSDLMQFLSYEVPECEKNRSSSSLP